MQEKKPRRAKAQLEINLATSVKDNKNWFYTLPTKEELRGIPILYWMWRETVIKDEEKACYMT